MELTKDDFQEIEKVLDVYSGWVSDQLNKLCNTAINWEAIKKEEPPVKLAISELHRTYERIREISKKLEIERKGEER